MIELLTDFIVAVFIAANAAGIYLMQADRQAIRRARRDAARQLAIDKRNKIRARLGFGPAAR